MSENKLIESEAFDWASLPRDLPKEFMVKIIAKTRATTYHKMTKPYIRIYTESELREAARSLVHNHIDLNHDLSKKIQGAYVYDAQYNEGNIECICYIPNIKVINDIKSGEISSVSVEENVREFIETTQGTELKGIVFTGLALMENSFLREIAELGGHVGDKNTKVELIESTYLMECEITKIEECKPECKEVQLPEKPVNTMANPQDPTLNLTPQDPLVPETNVASIGVIHDKGFGASGAGIPIETDKVPVLPVLTSPEVDASNPKKVDQVDVNSLPTKECGDKVSNNIDEEKMKEMVEATVAVEKEKEDNKKRIKELEEAVTRLQTSNKELETKFSKSVSEARKQGKEEVVNKMKAVVESEKHMNNRYNYTAQQMMNKVKKAIEESEK